MTSQRKHKGLAGSERPRPSTHKLVGPVDPGATIAVTMVVRRRPDGPPLPDLAHWQATPPGKRTFLSPEQYTAAHGAAGDDLKAVEAFAAAHGLTVLASHAGRRSVSVQGTAAQMNAAFGITLNHYEGPLPGAARRTRAGAAEPPAATVMHRHHGYDGAVHLPPELAGVVVAVVGLDNRRLAVPGGTASAAGTDPAGATGLAVPAAAQLYNFPNTKAADQTIGVIAPQGAAYLAADITNHYFPNLSNAAYGQAPASLNDISLTVGANTFTNDIATVQGITAATDLNSFPFSFIIELTQDISTSSTTAQGAAVNVYFTEDSEQGWLVLLNRVLIPEGESQPTVVTCSFTLYLGDDSSYVGSLGDSGSAVSMLTTQFSQLASLGINVFIALGDWGADNWYFLGSLVPPDGNSHVMYPGSDPWVTSCGGTIVAANASPPPAITEFVWQDAWSPTSPFGSSSSNFGSTGGGVSATFAAPPYQTAAGITGATDSAGTFHAGRGVPDIAAMVAFGGSGANDWFFVNGFTYGFTGTSCVAPFFAGLTATLRSAFGVALGFLNPLLYELAGTAFNDVTVGSNDSHDTPANVAIAIPGYSGHTPDAPFFSAAAGWDACSGLGSIDGTKLLNGIASLLYNQSFYFQVDKSTFGMDEVSVNSSYPPGTFWLVLEGFTPATAAGAVPQAAGAFTLEGVQVAIGAAAPELPAEPNTPQRILYPCSVAFPAALIKPVAQGGIFPSPGAAAIDLPLSAAITVDGQLLTATTVFELAPGADPSFANFDADGDNVFYLSQDLRVFTVTPGINKTPIGGVALAAADDVNFDTAAGFTYIQQLLAHLNDNFDDPAGTDPFTLLPDQSDALSADSSVIPTAINPADPGGTPFANYNFAVARVRLTGAPNETTPKNVRVFFRMFATETSDTDYQTDWTYPSTFSGGLPRSPLVGVGNVTLPLFATGNYEANGDFAANVDYSANSINNQPIQTGASGSVWKYYGCYLNVYPPQNTINGSSVQSLLPGTHHCIVAQIAYDDAPIPTGSGTTASPESSDKLAQRNLQITFSDNPGPAATHRVPQTFDLRPSAALAGGPGDLLDYPDELMIDWGRTPPGSVASIYWPQVDATDVLALAGKLYSTHQLTAADANTVQCTVPHGFTFVPVPPGIGQNFAGLFTVDLPPGVVSGQVFTIVVRRISTRGAGERQPPPPPPPQEQIAARAEERVSRRAKSTRNWRYVVGSFAVRIPVTTAKVMLPLEENTLAIMKWRLGQMEANNRWVPVLKRYIGYISARIDGLGGNSSSIQPSPWGVSLPPATTPISRPPATSSDQGGHGHAGEHTGKVNGVIYDRFGDFEGFLLLTETGHEVRFHSREAEIEALVRFAWQARVVITVLTAAHSPHRPQSIVLCRAVPQPRSWAP
jgi:hypothetical protein